MPEFSSSRELVSESTREQVSFMVDNFLTGSSSEADRNLFLDFTNSVSAVDRKWIVDYLNTQFTNERNPQQKNKILQLKTGVMAQVNAPRDSQGYVLQSPPAYNNMERSEDLSTIPFRILSGKDGSYAFREALYSQEWENQWRYELHFEKEIKRYLKMPETKILNVKYHPESNSVEILVDNQRIAFNLPLRSRRSPQPIVLNIHEMEIVIEIMR